MRYCVSSPNLRVLQPTASGVSPTEGRWVPNMLPTVDGDRKQRLAYAIRTARERRNLTPPQLAERMGRSRGTINDWENGKSAPSLLDLGALCSALLVDPRLFADLPPVPVSPVYEYLVEEAAQEGIAEGKRRGPRRVRAGAQEPSP